jgi:hypothetical protein
MKQETNPQPSREAQTKDIKDFSTSALSSKPLKKDAPLYKPLKKDVPSFTPSLKSAKPFVPSASTAPSN